MIDLNSFSVLNRWILALWFYAGEYWIDQCSHLNSPKFPIIHLLFFAKRQSADSGSFETRCIPIGIM